MICPECNTKTPNRYFSGRCTKCGYNTVFKVNDESKIADNFLVKKVKAISSNDWYYFTSKQLYYYLILSKTYTKSAGYIVSAIFSVIAVLIFSFFFPFNLFILIVTFILIFLAISNNKKIIFPYDFNKFKEIVIKRWELHKGIIKNLIREEDLKFNLTKFDDISNYSFDALLITGDNETANFLIKNDFHFKNKTAIVSINQYPQHMFPYVIEQVKNNLNIPVFLVHDADILGVQIYNKVKNNWFKNTDIKLYDLGLHPYHVLKNKKKIELKRENVTMPDIDLSNYSEKEQNWLKSGYYTELAIIPPVKLINILEYAVNLYKEKGHAELEKVLSSLFVLGLGLKLSKMKLGESSGEVGFDVDFGDDFG